MPSLVVRTFEDPFYDMTVPLDGVPYVFRMRFNQREECWYLSVYLEQEENGSLVPLMTGIKIVCGIDLFWRCADTRKPPGLLTAIANGDDDSRPNLLDLGEGKRVELVYIPLETAIEVAAT